VLTGGITAPAYGALFTLGISDKLHKAVGAHLPGLAFLFGKYLTAVTSSSSTAAVTGSATAARKRAVAAL
jgi:hypothetical protein